MRVRLKQPLHHEDLITIEGYISHLTKEEISIRMKTDINYKRIGDTNKWQRNKSKNKQLRLHKKKSLFTVKETINKLKREGSPCPDSLCRTVRRGSLSVRPTQPRDSCAIWELASWRPRRANGVVLILKSGIYWIGRGLPRNLLSPVYRRDRNLIQKHPHRHTKNNVSPNLWVPCGPIKVAHKISYITGSHQETEVLLKEIEY
ncbi:uncharacterized protein LOC119867668 isoform X1 [Canis lupus familiaris]|uniref:uncharacterized protein LOC119867668 isoform X1 n=1 Tax=Canis lupus familiaris TaxID=9615 RepID=UPI0018F7DF2B|nr:uncharacterized protein LOC119867668 isoform X1 [Canis lupus familiaris]